MHPLSVKARQWDGARPLECYAGKSRFGTGSVSTMRSEHVDAHGIPLSKRQLSAQTRWTDTVETPAGAVAFNNTPVASQGITMRRIQELINSDSCLSINTFDRQYYT